MATHTAQSVWGHIPYMMQLCQQVGISLNEPIRIISNSEIAGDERNNGKLAVEFNNTGLVNWQWEGADEMHCDGKVLWRFVDHVGIAALINGVPVCFKLVDYEKLIECACEHDALATHINDDGNTWVAFD